MSKNICSCCWLCCKAPYIHGHAPFSQSGSYFRKKGVCNCVNMRLVTRWWDKKWHKFSTQLFRTKFYYHMCCLSALQIELMQIDWTIHHLLLKFAWAENFASFKIFLFERNTCTYAPVIKDASALWFIGTQAVFGWDLCITALVLRFVKCINSTCLGSKNTSFNFNWGKKNSGYCCFVLES